MSAALDVKKKTFDEYNSISIIIITTTEMKTQVLVHKM